MDKPMMMCGHAANATSNGKPSCAICIGDPRAITVNLAEIDLTGRKAKCYCGKTTESNLNRCAFFEHKGADSFAAQNHCKNCHYYKGAHNQDYERVCNNFEPHGPFEFDSYYCGCHGWD
jgi:hypothetical protein